MIEKETKALKELENTIKNIIITFKEDMDEMSTDLAINRVHANVANAFSTYRKNTATQKPKSYKPCEKDTRPKVLVVYPDMDTLWKQYFRWINLLQKRLGSEMRPYPGSMRIATAHAVIRFVYKKPKTTKQYLWISKLETEEEKEKLINIAIGEEE